MAERRGGERYLSAGDTMITREESDRGKSIIVT